MTLRMAAHFAEDGRIIKHMAMVFVRVQRIKVLILVLGITALKFREFILGLVDHHMKDTGRMEKDMALALKPEADGYIEASGHRVLKGAMVFGKAFHQPLDMKEHGPMVYKMDTAQKHMQMEVVTRVNGCGACDMVMVCGLLHPLVWLQDLEQNPSEHR